MKHDYAQSLERQMGGSISNYADETQKPLKSYGEENIKKICAAAKKYDPEGVFQTMVCLVDSRYPGFLKRWKGSEVWGVDIVTRFRNSCAFHIINYTTTIFRSPRTVSIAHFSVSR